MSVLRAVPAFALLLLPLFSLHADEVDVLGPLVNAPAAGAPADTATIADILYSAPRIARADRNDLGPLTADERSALTKGASERLLRVGVERPVSADIAFGTEAAKSSGAMSRGGLTERLGETLFWTTGIRSDGANALRFEIAASLPQSARAYLYTEGGEVHGPYTAAQMNGDSFWTNIVYADEAFLELQIPVRDAGTASLRVKSVAHIEHPSFAKSGTGRPQTNGYECLLDVQCVDTSEFSNIAAAEKAIAQLIFQKSGSSYACSGGLLNNTRRDGTPYFLTANHCFSSQTEASTLVATWRYETHDCADPDVNPDRSTFPQTLGSTLLASSATSDYTFLRLSQNPPAGSTFLGWDGNNDYSAAVGTNLYRVHHPEGATQFYAREQVTTSDCVLSTRPRGNYIYEKDVVSGTFGGSSGSPLYLSNLTVVGQLYGACGPNVDDGCDRANNSIDGAFKATYPAIRSYLSPTAGGGFTCTPTATVACMLNNRFKVEVRYRNGFDNNAADTSASLKPVTGFATSTFETAFFYFNNSSNIEFMIKILDQGDSQNGVPTIDILTGLATPLRVEVTVTDSTNGLSKPYVSDFGTQAGKTDFNAFVK